MLPALAMTSASSPTSFADIHPLIIQTQIISRLDGQSLSSAAIASSYLRTVTADDILWSDICRSTWPSITHPRVQHVISTFPAGYRSFFQDSFQPPITDMKHYDCRRSWSSSPPEYPLTHSPSEIMSAVDIRYHDDIIYSRVEFTNSTTDFLSSSLRIVLKDDPPIQQSDSQPVALRPRPMDLKVDELVHADDAIMSHLKESITLNWILIEPTLKRAVNLSSIKPLLAWVDNDIHLRYVVVLRGCDSNEMVEFRIEVKLDVGKGGMALHVKEVTLYVQDMVCNCLSGKDFLIITSRVLLGNIKTKRAAVKGEAGSFQSGCLKKDETIGRRLSHDYIIPILSFLLCFCFLDIFF